MKILFINHMGFLGGGEKSMLALMDGLWETGEYKIALLAPEGELINYAREKGYQTFPFDFGQIRRSYNPVVWLKGLLGMITGIKQMERVIRDNQIYLVHANSLKAALMGGLAARRAKRPMIFHTRDFLSAGLFGKLLISQAYGLAARVIVNSKSVSQVYGLDPGKKVAVVYNCVKTPEQLSPEKRKEIRAKNGVSEKQFLIGYVGRLHPDKDIVTLLEGFKLLLVSIPEARLWIVGGAMPGEEQYTESLKHTSEKQGISRNTVFFGWRKDALELMGCFDLLVVPSKKEPFGRVTVEAMMLGIPVVATASGGTMEIVDDNITGLLFAPGDHQALAEKILYLLKDPTLKKELTVRAKNEVLKRFGKQQYIGGVQKVY
ncbi:MAG: glycosyltransferase family 4 protein, partial [bacterium]|nr:glycosyltransferase family 4 protein [bacterium]